MIFSYTICIRFAPQDPKETTVVEVCAEEVKAAKSGWGSNTDVKLKERKTPVYVMHIVSIVV